MSEESKAYQTTVLIDLAGSSTVDDGGRDRVRTCDLMLAKHALSQLSYTPTVGVLSILKHFSQFQNHSLVL
jgi:hypothetical protein